MIIFVLPLIMLITYISYEIHEYGLRFPDFEQIFVAVGLSLAGFIFGLLIAIFAMEVPGPGHVAEVETIKIHALQDNIENSGQYFLGSGSSSDKLEYYYVYETESGGYKIDTIEAKNATVYYTDDDIRVEKIYYEFDNFIHRFLGIGYYEYHIYIPRGSILNDYRIDLQ